VPQTTELTIVDIPSENTVVHVKEEKKKKKHGRQNTEGMEMQVQNPTEAKYIKNKKISFVPAPESPFIKPNFLKASEEQHKKNLTLVPGLEEIKDDTTPRFGEMMFNALAHKHREMFEPPKPKTEWQLNGF
jgi:hypothetical protein